eukprot:CAMPEP_0113326850 /NCGR_PEP_ID=MMETSP0010_2-20120614/18836_1 /TAXON_ID=216773 ORGANISM="Corethron hystrix, Strain 308" /NCGR_SAMPLE_ID=MMETSP0010_2 /ASSEMBLY_ACC=CAM_ASM_000155 /LENGTH=473 /DNA_ID=CAMNT_0000187399 /DNA_START=183 /DNA_END=1605 /DNA_ORIENTATION=- /assembly_acc=CAM_ASM_000155
MVFRKKTLMFALFAVFITSAFKFLTHHSVVLVEIQQFTWDADLAVKRGHGLPESSINSWKNNVEPQKDSPLNDGTPSPADELTEEKPEDDGGQIPPAKSHFCLPNPHAPSVDVPSWRELGKSTDLHCPLVEEVDLVVHLSGELANRIFELAVAHAIAWRAEEDLDCSVRIRLSFLSQKIKGKNASTQHNFKKCFPQWRDKKFDEYDEDEMECPDCVLNRMKQNFGTDFKIEDPNDMTAYDVYDQFSQTLNKILSVRNNSTTDVGEKTVSFVRGHDLTVPFVYMSGCWQIWPVLQGYRERLRHLFQIDEDGPCCNLRPDPDETVLHIRGFLNEMPRVAPQLGFTEVDPARAVELLKHLSPGDRVALVGRFPEKLWGYVGTLKEQGLEVRVVPNEGKRVAPSVGFCFIQHAKRGIAGMAMSTFVQLGAFFSDAERVDIYLYDRGRKEYYSHKLDDFFTPDPKLNDRYHRHIFKDK